MRCHDLCPKTDIDTLVNTIAANHVDQIQLAMGKSIAGYNFDQRGFSASGRTEKCDEFPVAYLKADVFQHLLSVEGFNDVFKSDDLIRGVVHFTVIEPPFAVL